MGDGAAVVVRSTASPAGSVSFGHRNDGKCTGLHGHDDVVALAHTHQYGVHFDWFDGKSVGVGDGHSVVRDGDSVRGVGSRVDESQSDPLSGLGQHGFALYRSAPVDHMERVGDVTVETRTRTAHHVAHTGLSSHVVPLARIAPAPGRLPNAHVDTSRPPTTALIADAVTVAFTTPAPLRRRFASRASTAGSAGPTTFDADDAVAAKAAGPPAANTRRAPPPASTSRRESNRAGTMSASSSLNFIALIVSELRGDPVEYRPRVEVGRFGAADSFWFLSGVRGGGVV